MKFYVSLAVDCRYNCEVEADSFQEAKEKAFSEFQDADIGVLECVDASAVNAEDENGNFLDY